MFKENHEDNQNKQLCHNDCLGLYPISFLYLLLDLFEDPSPYVRAHM